MKRHSYDCSDIVFAGTIKEGHSRPVYLQPLYNDETIWNQAGKPQEEVALVDGQHLFAAFQEPSSLYSPSDMRNHCLHILLSTMSDVRPMSLREIVLYGGSCNGLAGLVLSDLSIFYAVNTILTLVKTFELDYRIRFHLAIIQDITEDLQIPKFRPFGSFSGCLGYGSIAKYPLLCGVSV